MYNVYNVTETDGKFTNAFITVQKMLSIKL